MYLTGTLESWFKDASRQFPVVLVTGARQVGKSEESSSHDDTVQEFRFRLERN
jgi:hypothetical protein